jgi:mannose-6-phosphate isomerase
VTLGAQPVRGTVRHYPWGDHDFIPHLLGVEPDGRPWAELWLGTHRSAPSMLGDGTPLSDATGELPYLLKVLAAAEPLSLQVHPNTTQARDGYARGVYPDAHAKPELLVALTPFEALCGLRPVEATAGVLADLGLGSLAGAIVECGPAAMLTDLYRERLDAGPIIAACATSARPEARWVRTLDARYPGEPSVAATLLLNHVTLAPGEALHLTAGNLHAYLRGAGIELMGASDNVVRGGLTTKRVDVDELLRILDPTPLADPVVSGAASSGHYPLPEAGCELRRVPAGDAHRSEGHELAIALDGSTTYVPPGATYRPATEAYVVTTLSTPAGTA